jgi:hypothetical protein
MKYLAKDKTLALIKGIEKHLDPFNHNSFMADGYSHSCIKYPSIDRANYLSYQIANAGDPFESVIAMLTIGQYLLLLKIH